MKQLRNFGFTLIISCLAGSLASLNYAPYNLWWLNIAAIAILFWQLSKHNWFIGIACLYVFWAAYFISGMNWVSQGMAIYSRVSAEKAMLITVFVGLVYAAFLTIPWLLYAGTRSRSLSRLMLLPATWLLGEWWRYWLFDGLIWLIQGSGHQSTWLAGWIPVFGSLGASLFSVSTAALLVACLQCRSTKIMTTSLASIGLIWICGALLERIEWTQDMGYSIPVSSVQPNRPIRLGGRTHIDALHQQWMDDLETSSQDYWTPGILIWPEGAIKKNADDIDAYFDFIEQQALSNHSAFFSGGPFYPADKPQQPKPSLSSPSAVLRNGQPSYNSLFGLGMAEGKYHKVRRAPLGEYSPLDGRLGKLIPWLNSVVPPRMYGKEQQSPLSFSFAGTDFFASPSICYEIAFASLIRQTAGESNLLINISNDAWFNGTNELDQALEVAQIRALEHQKPLIRSTNSGLTASIDHKGNIIKQAPREVAGMFVSDIRPRQGQTPYSRWGDTPVLSLAALIILSVYLGLFLRHSRESQNST